MLRILSQSTLSSAIRWCRRQGQLEQAMMCVVDAPSKKDLNRLFSAALEFGKNWMRPVPDLAAERLTHRSAEERAAMAAVIEECRSDINAHIEEIHIRLGRAWDKPAARDVDDWIVERCPWMSKKNRRRAISQGQYYAWHDHG